MVAAQRVEDAEEVMLITNKGMLIRMPARQISVIGRNTQGVRLITVESRDEQVVAAARVAETSHEAEAAGVKENGNGESGEGSGGDEPGGPAAGEGEAPEGEEGG